ncbi:MAG: hypothetical protein V4493_01705 [Pseudomonadota bacterium]
MANGVWQATIVNANTGLPIPNAIVTVLDSATEEDAELFISRTSDTPLGSSSIAADENGFVRFYCAPGRYDINVTGAEDFYDVIILAAASAA